MLALARTFMFTPLVLVSVTPQAIPFLINVTPQAIPFLINVTPQAIPFLIYVTPQAIPFLINVTLALARTFMFIPFLINVFPLPFILFPNSVLGLSSFTKYIFLLYISDVNFAHSTNLSCDIKIIYLAFYSIVQLSDSLLKSDDNVVLYYG